MEQSFEWIYQVGARIVIGLEGDPSDCEYIKCVVYSFQRDHYLKFGKDVSVSTLAYFLRNKISDALRSKHPLEVNTIVAGWDSIKNKPQLFWLDNIGSIQTVDYCTHGRYTPFILSVLDRKNTVLSILPKISHSSQQSQELNTNNEFKTISSEVTSQFSSPTCDTHNDDIAHHLIEPTKINQHQRSSIKYASPEYGLDTMNECWKEVKKRSVSSLNKWMVKCIDKNGVTNVDPSVCC